VSKTANETYGLVKGGTLNALSMGFHPIESWPITGGRYRYTKWELLELSIVAVPTNPRAWRCRSQAGPSAGAALRCELAWAPAPARFVAAQWRLEEAEVRRRWFH
jgi:Caudovirus prohead serine protease